MNKIFYIISYIKEKFTPPVTHDSDKAYIIQEIKNVQKLINAAENNYNNVTDSDSIEYYIYILKAYRVRYNKLVKELKELHDACPNTNTPSTTKGLVRYKNYIPFRPTEQKLITEENLS